MMSHKEFRRVQAVFPVRCFDSYKILGKLNAFPLPLLSYMLEFPFLFLLGFKILDCRQGKEMLNFLLNPYMAVAVR